MSTVPAPAILDVRRLLNGLLGRPADVKDSGPGTAPPAVVGIYTLDTGNLVAACTCDLPLTAAIGAALSLMPPGVAAESVRRGKPSPEILDNLSEVLNVGASLLNKPGNPHVVYKSLIDSPATADPAVAKLMAAPAARANFAVSVTGYGNGVLSFFIG
jgi:hypothetical protein